MGRGGGLDPDPGLSAGATLQAPGHPSLPRPLAPGCLSFCAATLWRHPCSCSHWSVLLRQTTEGPSGQTPERGRGSWLRLRGNQEASLEKQHPAGSCCYQGLLEGAATSAEQAVLPAPPRRAAESLQSTFLSVTSSWLPRSPRPAHGKCPYWGGAGPTRDAGSDAQGSAHPTHCMRGLGVETGALPQSPARMFGVQVDLGGGVRAAPASRKHMGRAARPQPGPQRSQSRESIGQGLEARGLGQGGP